MKLIFCYTTMSKSINIFDPIQYKFSISIKLSNKQETSINKIKSYWECFTSCLWTGISSWVGLLNVPSELWHYSQTEWWWLSNVTTCSDWIITTEHKKHKHVSRLTAPARTSCPRATWRTTRTSRPPSAATPQSSSSTSPSSCSTASTRTRWPSPPVIS